MSMYTLLCSITGGIDWRDAAVPVWDFGWLYGVGFMGFVLISILGILNVVTSVFVERAQNMKRLDRDFAISEEMHIMEKDVEDTMDVFKELDPDCKGAIAVKDLRKFLQDDHVVAHF